MNRNRILSGRNVSFIHCVKTLSYVCRRYWLHYTLYSLPLSIHFETIWPKIYGKEKYCANIFVAN
jgi:hypothetical protein